MSIIIKNISMKFKDDNEKIIDNLSFTINDGEWLSIIGHNGSGKTTLAKLIIGLYTKDEGTIIVQGIEQNDDNLYEIRKHIGIVFQNPDNQFVATSVEEDVAFGLENLEVPQDKMADIIYNTLQEVDMLEYREKEPHNLSGGQKQRVAIAGILAMNPEIIVLDEATSMLDPEGKKEFINTVKKLKESGKTIIMITHDMNEAMLSDRTIVLSKGKILKDGPTKDIMLDKEVLEEAKLEMPGSLYVYHKLKELSYKNKEVLEALWEFVSLM